METQSSVPLYRQIAHQLRRGVLSGALVDGEKLPTAKTLAMSLDVNLHTVLRAYALLRDEGLIQMRRGRGTTVTASKPPSASLSALARTLLDEARRQGVSADEVATLLTQLDG